MVAGADPLRWRTVHGRRRTAEPCRPKRSGGPEWACFLERSGREEPVRRGPTREIARGGAAAGKKLGHDGFVRAGDVHRSNAKAGVRPQRRTAADLSMPDPLQARRRPCARCSPGRCACVHSGIGKPHARPRCRDRLLSRIPRMSWANWRARVMPSAAYFDVTQPFDTSIARP